MNSDFEAIEGTMPSAQVFYSVPTYLDSLTALRMSAVVALVLMPGTSKGDFAGGLNTKEKASPFFLSISSSSARAISNISDKR